ncbi:hypothetical protein GCM10011342_06570 [Aquisalinus flavus]|uniref:Peptidase A2 domain-containing protein n=2 Tax=Aquisalinus flavus TaxID=1526572 RepID=A0A8J2V3X5_9PROT|nr:hypothetical protein GCM10011342_06570 [Aquisalinus flavus]
MIHNVLVFGAAALLTGCATVADDKGDDPYPPELRWTGEARAISLPCSIRHGALMIEASLDGTPLSLMLDTGANATFLYENERTRPIRNTGVLDGRPELAFDGFAIRPRFVGFFFEEQIFVKMSVAAAMDVPIDGVIGYDFFEHLAVTIAPDPCTVTVRPPRRNPYRDEDYALPLVLGSNVPVTLGDIEVTTGAEPVRTLLLIDTGYSGTLELVSSSAFAAIETGKEEKFVTIKGIHSAWPGRIASLKLGGKFRVEDVHVMLTDEHAVFVPNAENTEAETGTVPNGILGLDFLGRYEFTVDYTNKRLAIGD